MSTKRKMRRRGGASQPLYEIVYDRIVQPWEARLSQEMREALPVLHAMVREDPHAAVPELRKWIEREPLPVFFNWLGAAYSALRDTEAVRETVRENYRRNPDYLFARANFAELCLNEGDLPAALEALGPKLDIRPFLGNRKRVHVSEVVGYFYAVALYHLKSGDRAAAERVYEMLDEVAPGEMGTEDLRRRLHPSLRDLFSR